MTLILIGAVASYEDIKSREISNKIILTGFIAGSIIGIYDKALINAFIGSFIMAAPLYALAYIFLHLTGKQGLGGGDVKMALVYGLYLKYLTCIFAAYFITFILAGMFLLIYRFRKDKKTENSGIPLIPFMSIGTIVVHMLQNAI